MRLVMFDVDGTLTESSALDSATYLDVLREIFGFHDVSGDRATYRHVTDTGILAEIFQTRLGRLPTPEETDAIRNRFSATLAERINAAADLRPVAGAAELLARLAGQPDEYAAAYASGGWGVTRASSCAQQGCRWTVYPERSRKTIHRARASAVRPTGGRRNGTDANCR